MKAVLIDRPGDESVMRIGEVADPAPGAGQLLLKVRAAALNRADLVQRQGHYPPPPGASEILGLECTGEVATLGTGVRGWSVGERAMALLPGGGYAEKCVVDQGCAMRVPAALSDDEAAALPEVFLTVFLNLFMIAGVTPRDTVLIHGGGSGIGTASIAMLKEAGARAIVTVGSDEKAERCRELGADLAINYRTQEFPAAAASFTGGRGVDIILDSIGGEYLARNLRTLAPEGRLVMIGLMRGARAEIDLAPLMLKHLRIIGSTLRSRPVKEKAAIVSAFLERFGPALEAGRLKPVVYRALPLSEVAAAHRMMQASEHFGKIVLRP